MPDSTVITKAILKSTATSEKCKFQVHSQSLCISLSLGQKKHEW